MKCIKCGETKESEFLPNHTRLHDYRCKSCISRMSREYHEKHRDKHLQYLHKYYLEHQEKKKEYNQRNWGKYQSDPEYRERRKKAANESHARIKLNVLSHYSNGKLQCAICGFNDIRALCLDHINNCGMKKRFLTGSGGRKLAFFLSKNNFPEGFQVLCANCNSIKEIERRKREGRNVLVSII